MEKINKICFIIVLCILSFVFGGVWQQNRTDTINKIVISDTIYNKVTLDSIEYNIIKKDSVIVELKKKIAYEMEQAINANDSDAIKQFKELAGSE